jgi:hypothetical protein
MTSRLVPVLVLAGIPVAGAFGQAGPPCPQHSRECPAPRVIEVPPPGPIRIAPSDAIVLFDGEDISPWRSADGGPPRWSLGRGYLEVVPGAGALRTLRSFADVQLHIEWATPTPPDGTGQDRGNSGVFLMGRYEVQVLDSYGNATYADGSAGAVYGQYPPLVDPSRGPGEWQSYDIIFHRPRFDADGRLVTPARFTVLHNGILVQDNVSLTGPTGHQRRPPYEAHADRLPLVLQDHGQRVRYRNIWIRELEP